MSAVFRYTALAWAVLATLALVGCPQPTPNIQVPNVAGQTQPNAQTTILAAGLAVGAVTQQSSATVPVGDVISQTPAAGASVPPGTAINLVISSGPQPLTVPNVVGLLQAAAQTAITNAGLTVGAITQQTSETVPAGQVLGQDPAAGASVAPGAAVNLAVSVGPPVTVPNVVNMMTAAAQTAITSAGLTVGAITQTYSPTIPAGAVISQDPAAGASIAPGAPVNLTISSGPPPVTVPAVTGMSQADAQTAITNAGLTVGTVSQQYSATVPVGSVISQTPAAGSSASPGTAVSLLVSKGAGPAPNVVGATLANAQTAITAVGLSVGTVTLAYSDTVPVTEVISQDPAAGAILPPGAPVNLVISNGPRPVTVPLVVGIVQADAQTAIINAGLTIGTVTQQFSATVPSGEVISQTPAAGSSALPGSAVNLVVSKGAGPVPNVVGQSQGTAQAAIIAVGLTVGTVTQAYSGTVPAGDVISQVPAPGTIIAPGMPVSLVVSSGPQPVAVPAVVGMTQAAAQAAIIAAGLTVGTVTQQYSATIPIGQVVSQTPAPASSALPGAPVNLVVSKGVGPVPYVVGDIETAAQAAITADGLTVGAVTMAYSLTVSMGRVISQIPEGGAIVTPGTPVNLVVSQGPLIIPNLVGMAQTDAVTAITALGLAVGTVTQQYSATVPVGQVLSQAPVGGASALPGVAVNLVVSKGAGPAPSVLGDALADAQTAITAVGLTVGAVTQANSQTVPVGDVISQDPSAGAILSQGAPVNLVISNGPQLVSVPAVVGLAQAAAQTAITNAGLTVGTITTAYSDTVPVGDVIACNPAVGAQTTLGSPVDLTVSLGPEFTQTGVLFALYNYNNGTETGEYDLSDLSTIWQKNSPIYIDPNSGTPYPPTAIAASTNYIYLLYDNGKVFGQFNAADLTPVWLQESPAQPSGDTFLYPKTLAATNNALYFLFADGQTIAKYSTGAPASEIWTRNAPQLTAAASPYPSQIAVAGTAQPFLYCLYTDSRKIGKFDEATFTQIWLDDSPSAGSPIPQWPMSFGATDNYLYFLFDTGQIGVYTTANLASVIVSQDAPVYVSGTTNYYPTEIAVASP